MRITALTLIAILIASPSFSVAQDPLEAVKQNIESGIRVLEDPRYEDDSRKKEQQQVLFEIMQHAYDFHEFSRRVLGSHWHKFSQRQRDEFVRLFSEFLGKFYLGKLQNRYNGQRVNYLSQQILSATKARVEIEVVWRKLKDVENYPTWQSSVRKVVLKGGTRITEESILQFYMNDYDSTTYHEAKITKIEDDKSFTFARTGTNTSPLLKDYQTSYNLKRLLDGTTEISVTIAYRTNGFITKIYNQLFLRSS